MAQRGPEHPISTELIGTLLDDGATYSILGPCTAKNYTLSCYLNTVIHFISYRPIF